MNFSSDGQIFCQQSILFYEYFSEKIQSETVDMRYVFGCMKVVLADNDNVMYYDYQRHLQEIWLHDTYKHPFLPYIRVISEVHHVMKLQYRKISNISGTRPQILNVHSLGMQLSSCNLLKPSVKWRMKIWLEQRRDAMLQLYLSDQQFNCVLY